MKVLKESINADYVRQCLEYDPLTGVFIWKHRPLDHFKDLRAQKIWNTRYSGKQAGAIMPIGYMLIRIHKLPYYAHRLAWLYVYGEWPNVIDHINGSEADNRIDNLRSITQHENLKNMRKPVHNSSGVLGVCIPNDGGRIQARVNVNGKGVKLGRYDSVEEAAAARLEANRIYGFHENHGR